MQKVFFPNAIHMLNICPNMQEYEKNMYKYAKYAIEDFDVTRWWLGYAES